MSISEGISAKFANMGFVCVCLVVLMHVHCPWEGGGISQLAVPFFFAMSGYFLASHVDEKRWYVRALSKRIRTLLVPLFAWCLIWAMFSIPLAVVLNIHAGRDLFANVLTGWGLLRYLALDITNTPALGPLWFIRCLFLFVIISPLIVWMIRKTGLLILIVFGGLYLTYVGQKHMIRFLSYGFSLEGVLYFSAGIFLRMKRVPLTVDLRIGVALFILGLFAYICGFVVPSIALMIVGLWGLMPTRRFPRPLTNNIFSIYLIHMFVLTLFGSGKVASALLALGMGFVAIAISIIIAEGIRRTFPRWCIVLWGGR